MTTTANPHATPQIALGTWLERQAFLGPERPALTYGGQTWTYAEFMDRVDRLAAGLAAGGVTAGDRVAYLGLNHPAFLQTLFACSRIGAIFVPLNFRLTSHELEFIIGDAGAHTVIADAMHAPLLVGIHQAGRFTRAVAIEPVDLPGFEQLDELTAAEPLTEPVHPRPDDVAVIMYTSGTTGRPKGAMLTHGNLFYSSMSLVYAADVLRDDVTLVAAPLFHIGGLNVTTLVTLAKGGEAVIMPAFDPVKALDLIESHRVTTMFGAPAMFQFMAQTPGFADRDLSSIRHLVCGGAPVPEALITTYSAANVPFLQGYGLTETAPLGMLLGAEDVATRIGAAGRGKTFISEARLVDPTNQPVPFGERGEICIRGPQVMAGYWHNPEATAAVIDDEGWFHSGDIGRYDDDGYIYVVDRVKDMIISGAENIYPAEVESALYAHPAVAEVAVIGVADEKWGEVPAAIVALKPGTEATAEELTAVARERLASYKVPKTWNFVDALPRNPAGKIIKFQLREEFGKEPAPTA